MGAEIIGVFPRQYIKGDDPGTEDAEGKVVEGRVDTSSGKCRSADGVSTEAFDGSVIDDLRVGSEGCDAP